MGDNCACMRAVEGLSNSGPFQAQRTGRLAHFPRPCNDGRMLDMVIGASIIKLNLPGIRSLKQKRSIIKGLSARIHKQFNVSCGEVDGHDLWQSATLGVVVVSTSSVHAQSVLEGVVAWIEYNRPDVVVIDHTVEIIT